MSWLVRFPLCVISSLRPFHTIRFQGSSFVGSEIGSCEHSKNDSPTHRSVSLKKWMEIEGALFSSDALLER